jgi:hypothetical protein
MPPNIKPPTQAEIEEAIKKMHSAQNSANSTIPITPTPSTIPVTPIPSVTPVTPIPQASTGNSEIGAALAQFEKEQEGIVMPQTNDAVDVS